MRTYEEAKRAFKPTIVGEEQTGAITVIEAEMLGFLEHVFNEVPESADRTAGVRKLLEAKQAFIQSITHDWEFPKSSGQTKAAS